jgi:hypothetical protein
VARHFSAANDEIRCSLGGCNLTAAFTLAFIGKRGADNVYHGVMGTATTGSVMMVSIEIRDNTAPANSVAVVVNGGTEVHFSTTLTWLTTDGWSLITVTKASGTVAPLGWKYRFDTDAWTTATSGSTAANQATTAGGTVRFGEWADLDDFNGDLAVAGMWTRALSDAEIRNLPFSLSAWHASAPTGLWLFDQDATTQKLLDLAGGGANEAAGGGGTSVSTLSVPVFSYGAPVVKVSRQPAAVGGGGTVAPRRLLLGVGI